MKKHQIAQTLGEIAFFLWLGGENPYKARAYQQAGSALLASPDDVATLVETGTLLKVKGIGPATASVITDLVRTGSSPVLLRARGDFPSSLKELGDVPGLSQKQILRLYERGGITSLAELQAACAESRLLAVPGFGPKAQDRIRETLGLYQRGRGHRLYADVLDEAERVRATLAGLPGVRLAVLAGALRRKVEVIDHLRVVVMMRGGVGLADVRAGVGVVANLTDVDCKGRTITARSPFGLRLTIDLATPDDYGLALLLSTGSQEHLDGLLRRFTEQGFKSWDDVRGRLVEAASTEEALYRAAGLAYIYPELREGRGEIAWASAGDLPDLVQAKDIQGLFHAHTTYTDGAHTIEEMTVAARDRGYRYIGISDHSRSAHYVNGLEEHRIRAQWAEIDDVQRRHPDIHIFKGIEADILPNGTMDYPDELLAEFDFVIASVHSRFNLPEEEQTRRVCRALTNPYVTMLGHPTGRLLLSRAGYRIEMGQVLDAAAKHGKMIEINGSRHRLDLDWRWVQSAKERGIRLCVNPDAHAKEELMNVELGVNVARKGGLIPADIANTAPLGRMKTLLRTMKSTTV